MAKRRGKGEGSLQRRKDGRWSVTFSAGYQEDGKLLRKTVYGATQEEALANAQRMKRQMEQGIVINKRLIFGQWADEWYKGFQGSVSDVTYENYKYTLRQAKALLGKKPLHAIRAADIERALKTMIAKGYSPSQVTKVKAMLNQIFRKAAANGMIESNPVTLTDRLRLPRKKSGKDSFTPEELKRLFQKLPKNRTGHAIRLSIACGLRPQELLGLEREHISPDGGMLFIRQAVKLLRGTVSIGETKSQSGERDIPVPAFARESARYLREQADGFVMGGKQGLPINPSTWRDYYRRAIQSIEGVRPLPPHCCRHTYITLLHASGVDFDTIQALAGQSDEDATRGYMHIKEEVTAKAVKLLEAQLSDLC